VKNMLSGRIALITGGSRGLGLLLARELGLAGCRVAICGRSGEALEWARVQLERQGINALCEVCDVSQRPQVERLVEHVRRQLGPIDVLVNNAGIMEVGPVQHMAVEDFQQALGVMFWGTVYAALAVYPDMVQRGGGHIVNITSIGGKVSVPHLLPYSTAKFAAVGFSEGLHAELARYGVKVLTVVPGLMRTGSYANVFVRSRPEREFTWFALAASLPLLSMDAERAARQIVRAMVHGRAEVLLSWPARLPAAVQGVLPGLTATVLGLVNRLILPPPGRAGGDRQRGGVVGQRLHSSLLDLATVWGRAAADRLQPPN